MAPLPTYVKVGYLDAAERTSEVTYRLQTEAEDDGSNMADVFDAVADLETALNVLTWSHIAYCDIVVRTGGSGAAANISANNQVVAFTRTLDTAGAKSAFEVPAWDDFLYDQDSNNLLSAAYNTAAAAVVALIQDPETGIDMDSVSFTQSRTRRGARHLS